jgi:NAD(P)-dependent dehydrogenase (short-subunit alcohol dehydrogenase family)
MLGAMKAPSFDGKLALITGAGSGIGQATAAAFAHAGADLVLCDIDEAGLEATAAPLRGLGRRVGTHRVDVSSREQMRAFAEEVERAHGAVDVLVNNAGVAIAAPILETSLEDWDWIVSINLWGVVHGCHFFAPAMVRRGRGHIVNLASVAGLMGGEPLGAYSTTKFAVVGYSESLRDELASHGVGVTAICPGVINTSIARNTRARGAWEAKQPRFVSIFQKQGHGPEKVASAILDAVVHDRGLVPVTPEAWAIYLAKRAAPDATRGLFRRVRALTGM